MVGKTLLRNSQLFATAANTRMSAVTLGRYMRMIRSLCFDGTIKFVGPWLGTTSCVSQIMGMYLALGTHF
jgi:hypothetical protein